MNGLITLLMTNGKHDDMDGMKAIELAWQAMGSGDKDAVRVAAARLQGLCDLHCMSDRVLAAVRFNTATAWNYVQE